MGCGASGFGRFCVAGGVSESFRLKIRTFEWQVRDPCLLSFVEVSMVTQGTAVVANVLAF